MSRFIRTLCVLAFATTPLTAQASVSFHHERPDAYRHAINAVVGDVSFVERFGAAPTSATNSDLRVRTHLDYVHALLSRRDVSSLPAPLRDARRDNLARLRAYIDAGVFPRNQLFDDQNRPCFIDAEGRICAVGYLVEQSAGREAAERINARFQSEFLWRMELPELDRWVAASGLTLLELSMIQPCYDPEFSLTVTQISDLTVLVRGTVIEYCCGMKFVAIDFGEVTWNSGEFNSWYVPVNVRHTFSHPGSYAIVVKAVAADACYGMDVETYMMVVKVGGEPLRLTAVEIPGGPPYQVYLTTTDAVAVDCLAASTAQWDHYDWAVEPITWYWENGVYRTPVHEYTYGGVMTVSVQNVYRDDCYIPNQAGLTNVNVNGVASDRIATWGQIKALYR